MYLEQAPSLVKAFINCFMRPSLIQDVHKACVHFKRFITLFVFAIEIICKKCYKVSFNLVLSAVIE